MVAAPADEGGHGDALYASSTPRSCLPCLQIATPATERGEVRSAGGRPRRWRRRRTAPFRLLGQRPGASRESRASERAEKAAAATLLHGLVRRRRARSCRGACWPRSNRWAGPATAVSSVRRTAPSRSRRAALPLISSTDAASSTSDAASGRGTRHPSAVALPRWRARTRRVRAQPRTSRARYCCSRRRGDPLRYYGRLRLHAGRFVK